MSAFRTIFFSLLLSVGLTDLSPSYAAETEAVVSPRDTASLVTDSDSVAPGQMLKAGLLLHLKAGWHTYWKNPGDAGEPVTLSVNLSGAVTGHGDRIVWPAPQRLPEGPLMSYGYTGDVLLPLELLPVAGEGKTATLTAHADWLVCAAVCIPEQADFHLALPVGTPVPSAQAPLFAAAAARVPRPSPFAATIAPDGQLTVRGNGLTARTVERAWFIPDRAGWIDQVATQKPSVSRDRLILKLHPSAEFPKSGPLTGVLELQDQAGEKTMLSLTAAPGPTVADPAVADPMARSWLSLLGLAFLGGLILNLMPCVFPVLAMKALAVLRTREERRHVASGLAYTAGVLVMFGGLGILALVLRHADMAVGWGFQFQSPFFVTAICWLLFAVALGLLGLFELPVIAAGQTALMNHRGLLGDGLTGVLAVLVATPCTAPFMGGAIAGALVSPPPVALGLFLAMGSGLAFPYLLLAVLPGAGRLLPRPGPWMETLRQFLAFPVLATCVWLLWVLARQAADAVAFAGGGFLLLGLSGWLAVRSRQASRSARSAMAAAVCVALLPFCLLPFLPLSVTEQGVGAQDPEVFSSGRLAGLRREGRPVFVDMTAAWCITCLVNERLVLDSPSIRKAFSENGVTFLRGDWTSRNLDITAFLHEHGREGVPLYIYYPPQGEARLLPQILTSDLVIGTIKRR